MPGETLQIDEWVEGYVGHMPKGNPLPPLPPAGPLLPLGFGFGLISSLTSSIIASLTSSIIVSFTGSSLLNIFSICSRVSSSDIFDYLYIILTK